MSDPRPKEYHDAFWRIMDQFPDTRKRFEDSGYDWCHLPEEDRRICEHADEIAKSEARKTYQI